MASSSVQSSPPVSLIAAERQRYASAAACRSLEVAAACYSHGVLLLADTAGLQGRSRLLVASQDLTSPPAATGLGLGTSGLRETVTELEVLLPGDAWNAMFTLT